MIAGTLRPMPSEQVDGEPDRGGGRVNQSSVRAVLLVLILVASGCGFTITAPRDYTLGEEPEDGIAIGSFTHVYERIVSTGEHPDVSEPMIDGNTRMVAVVLPEGDYEFYRWRGAAAFGYTQIETHLMHVGRPGEPLEASGALITRPAP